MDTTKIDILEQELIETFGYESLFEQVSKYLSYDEKEEMYNYIVRVNDLESEGY